MFHAVGTKGGCGVTTLQAIRAYAMGAAGARPHAVRESSPVDGPKPRLLDRVRAALRTRHYSGRTEEAYVAWIRRYIFFHGKRHPAEMGALEVTTFLSALAVEGRVAASTQNQALSALLFLYRDVLDVTLPWLDDVVRAKRPQRLPVVLSREEVRLVLEGRRSSSSSVGPTSGRSSATPVSGMRRRITARPLPAASRCRTTAASSGSAT